MQTAITKFEALLNNFQVLYSINSVTDFEAKPLKNKWSKKEILGHLVDSAINNISRFTEIQSFEKPYIVKTYNQDELVKSNYYQNENSDALVELWTNLNLHILHIVKNQTKETLAYQLILPDGNQTDLQFLIEDYFDHLYYHLNQINPKWI